MQFSTEYSYAKNFNFLKIYLEYFIHYVKFMIIRLYVMKLRRL